MRANLFVKTYLSLFIGVFLVTSYNSEAHAQARCVNLFTERVTISEQKELANINAVTEFKKVSLSRLEKAQINEIIRPYKIDKYKDVTELATLLADKIEARHLDQVEQGKELSKVGNNIYDKLETRLFDFFKDLNLNKDKDHLYNFNKEDIQSYINEKFPQLNAGAKKVKFNAIYRHYNKIKSDLLKVRYNFSEQVARLEKYQLSEYQVVENHATLMEGYSLISLKEYPKFAMALAKDIKPPKKYGSGGVLQVKEYRDIISTNLWLFTLQGHDLKHIHFGHAHPMATAAFFRSTRSKNHLRFFLMAGAYEGVDTVQYSYETRLAQHFSNKGYSLEQAMLYISMAPQAELVNIAKIIGVSYENYNVFETWKPSTLPLDRLPLNATTPEKLDQEVINFMSKSIADLNNPLINFYMKPELIPDGIQLPAGTENKPGEDIHYNNW